MSTTEPGEARVVGQYEILGKLGQGGTGKVYKAYDRSLKRIVALKILSPELAADSDQVQRFLKEARITAGLRHPNIVSVNSVALTKKHYVLSMEYIEGETLASLLGKEKRLSCSRAVDIAGQIAAALAEAHRHHLIHRDIKPQNIMLLPDGQVKVLDFGLAKILADATHFTAVGFTTGTPAYMSPEQCRNQSLDGRTDIYSLGMLLYEMLTGSLPFESEDPMALMYQIVHKPLPPPGNVRRDIPAALDKLVMAMTAKAPSERPSDAKEVYGALTEIAQQMSRGFSAGQLAQTVYAAVFRTRRRSASATVIVAASVLLLFGAYAYIGRIPTAWQEANPPLTPVTRAHGMEVGEDILTGNWIVQGEGHAELFSFTGGLRGDFRGLLGGMVVTGQYTANTKALPMEIDFLDIRPSGSFPMPVALSIMRCAFHVEDDKLTLAMPDFINAAFDPFDFAGIVQHIQAAPRPTSFEQGQGKYTIVLVKAD